MEQVEMRICGWLVVRGEWEEPMRWKILALDYSVVVSNGKYSRFWKTN